MNKKLNRPGASLVIANWADLDKNENILTDALDSPRAFKAGISRAVEDAIRRWWKRNRCEKNSCFRIFDLGSGSGSDIDKAIELLLHEIEQNPPVHKDTHIKIDAALIDSCQSVLDSETKKTVTL